MAGEWTEQPSLWDDAALLFGRKQGELCVLDGGSGVPRRIWKNPDPRGSIRGNAAWSGDGETLYIWLSNERQLCAIDTRTGHTRELLELGTRFFSWNPWYVRDTLDPEPVRRSRGLVVDDEAGRLLFLLQEAQNSSVFFWQWRMDRGGAWLAELDLDDRCFRPLFDKSVIPRGTLSWDLSLPAGRLYTITSTDERDEIARPLQQIQERSLDGTLLRAFGQPPGRAFGLELSPDGRRLLVRREYKPGIALPRFDREHSLAETKSIVAAQDGGFLIVDLESGQSIDGPNDGSEAQWAPDGDRIVLIDGWDLLLCAVGERSMTPLAIGGPARPDWQHTWAEPVWSPDGRRLAITATAAGWTLLLDLSRREFFVIPEATFGKRWAPTPHPFAEMPTRHGRS